MSLHASQIAPLVSEPEVVGWHAVSVTNAVADSVSLSAVLCLEFFMGFPFTLAARTSKRGPQRYKSKASANQPCFEWVNEAEKPCHQVAPPRFLDHA